MEVTKHFSLTFLLRNPLISCQKSYSANRGLDTRLGYSQQHLEIKNNIRSIRHWFHVQAILSHGGDKRLHIPVLNFSYPWWWRFLSSGVFKLCRWPTVLSIPRYCNGFFRDKQFKSFAAWPFRWRHYGLSELGDLLVQQHSVTSQNICVNILFVVWY
jgi:hypothetical protein